MIQRLKTISPLTAAKYVLASTLVFAIAIFIYVAIILSSGLPTLEQLENPKQDLATQVYSADGELLEHFATTRRTYLPYDSIPKSFIDALIATEDREFRGHWGVHTMRIAKAAIKNIFAARAKEGASTITQQLARNLYFTQERSATRKIREAWTAFQIERTYTKNEILEMYSNTVYYGRGAYGIRVAAQVYFNKEPMRLTLAESAYLVGLFKAPERYASDDSLGIMRRNLILTMMSENGFITGEQYLKATSASLAKPLPNQTFRGIAPHFVETIRQQLGKDGEWSDKLKGYDLYRDGLVIYTTLDARIQRYANEAVADHLTQYQQTFSKQWSWKGKGALLNSLLDKAISKRPDYIVAKKEQRAAISKKYKSMSWFVDSVKREATIIQTGLVVIDPRTGGVTAMVGASPRSMMNNPAARYSLNHATQIKRQPGSSFKPFVYAAAMEAGLTPESTIESGPFSITLPSGDVWAPQGSSKNGGPMSLRSALKFSTNSVAARLITEHTNPTAVVRLCHQMGIKSTLRDVPSLALGSAEVSPLELTSAYGTLLNQGVSVEPAMITRIEDRMGNVLYQAKLPSVMNDAISPQIARNMVSIMRGVVDGGTASNIRRFYKYDAAGKTGTTNDFADAWFVGFTPQLVCGVWVGFDDRRIQFTGDYGQGGRAAAPAWGRLMQKVYNNKSLGYKQLTFAIERDSTDTLSKETIINPPREEINNEPDSTRQ